MRCAPPRSAAIADATESVQTSNIMAICFSLPFVLHGFGNADSAAADLVRSPKY